MVVMLFLISGVEAVFVYPWAVLLRELSWAGLWQMAVFLGILRVAFVYEICRAALEWDAVTRRAQRPLLPRVA